MKLKKELLNAEGLPNILQWFEEKYTPGEKGRNGNPRAAEFVMRGIKGNIVIRMMYEQDLV